MVHSGFKRKLFICMKGTQTQPSLSTVNKSGGKTQGIFCSWYYIQTIGLIMDGSEGVPSLQQTKSKLKMDDWKTVSFPFLGPWRSLAGADA